MIGIARGFVTTMTHLVRPAITERYPQVKPTLPERSRTSFALLRNKEGELLCKACLLCARDCPDSAIEIVAEKPPEGGPRVLTRFAIDLGRCMYCGLCVESCTSDALAHTGDFEQATTERSAATLVLFDAATAGPPTAERAEAQPTEAGPAEGAS